MRIHLYTQKGLGLNQNYLRKDLNRVLQHRAARWNYFNSTSAPASSRDDLRLSASSLETPSLIAFGALSTISLASLRPKPVNSLTNFTTANLEAPAALRITSNSVCSSAASPPPAAAPPATATAAAAGSIPYSSFNISANSFTSLTVILTNCSTTTFKSAIFYRFNIFLKYNSFKCVLIMIAFLIKT